MARHEWKFSYASVVLQKAAESKALHHREREKWWDGELTKADGDLREHGITMQEVPVTGGTRLQAFIDPTKQACVEECRRKKDEHKSAAEDYEAYARAFAADLQAKYFLDISDMKYFGI
jgi:hypothetical protein